jgi:hypothetical protein
VSVDTLFNAGSLADFLIDRWCSFIAELDAPKRQLSDATLPGQVEELGARYMLTVPALKSGFRVVAHGASSEPDPQEPMELADYANEGDLLQAQMRQIEAQIRRLSRTRTIVAVAFTGSSVLFRYRPSGCVIPAPPGELDGQSILLQFERSGREDKVWKSLLQADLHSIEEILEAAHPEVAAFNAAVAKALEGACAIQAGHTREERARTPTVA